MAFDQFPQLSGGAWAVDPSELKEAFLFLTQSYQDLYQEDMSKYHVEVRDEEGNAQYLPIEDTPVNRVLLALRDWLHEETTEKFISIAWRIIALTQLIKSGILDEWVKNPSGDESLMIPGPIIYVAATLPLETSSGYDPDLFIQAVREITLSGL